ncbi:alpha-hydroxy-acid oxidizing protein [Bacilliculturomica massiliensis]|uniref:alpha-hydroxy-acid oxidizing protein n=1 Tax=Bacilliculturomica massiliensis TaxID=1917867 RepID=UPI001031576F|nr:alpha-hydroxy-acid oxidizing protein [Bacilliculturomica massiliensis]
MDYKELLENARKALAPKCRVCRVCNGAACRGELPGSGGKGTGESFVRAYEKLSEVKINMDTIYENRGQDTTARLFGHTFAAPVFAAPISGMSSNYTGYFTETAYNECVVGGTRKAGCSAFTGDGVSADFFEGPLSVVKKAGGMAIPTIKPWDRDTVLEKVQKAQEAGAFAVAMDIDSAGLPILALAGRPGAAKSVEELAEIRRGVKVPFILKGIMTAEGAKKALEAGADAIIVSNHGGRVLDHSRAPVEVLPSIRKAVGDQMTILIDGAIRTGVDVFKVLALGADGALIGRPYVTAAHGGGEEGVALYTNKIIGELADTMKMTGCAVLSDITPDKVDWEK